MATTEKLQNEILLKEEAFLKEAKAKLTEQLNKLKVEEMALMKMLKTAKTSSPHTNTMGLFSKSSSSSLRIDNLEKETAAVNHIPLPELNTAVINKDADIGEEEYEDEDDEDDDVDVDTEDEETGYSQQLMNAMSNLHHNSDVDGGISRSVFRSVLQQEFDDLDEDDGYL
ncbi:snRNA-activating protein complex subunit 5-like isoform X2 [Montipora capricornis]|uniref:snRNA-activating protein complex subunit 5-like isoform X2 n=1 Tax=Montipora capricornis TaxID=246305 RepID=UPI0035F169D4